MILVTGAAGFIGYHVARKLLERGDEVVGLDNLNDYYDPSLKEARLDLLRPDPRFRFVRLNIADRAGMEQLFARHRPARVVHLAAQAGVRYSLTNPTHTSTATCRAFSTSSKAAGTTASSISSMPLRARSTARTRSSRSRNTTTSTIRFSLYAATKKANELMAHTYASLYGLPCTGLRFFTVYGPWGRPDMALFKFTRGILAGEPIPVYNEGRMIRDFTYIDDAAEGVVRMLDQPAVADSAWSGAAPDPARSYAPYRVYNIGNSRPVQLLRYIALLEECLGMKAKMELLPMQPGDVPSTMADVSELESAVAFHPRTTVEDGVAAFVRWYRDYYKVGAVA
jgi:UDP-glucuronate 4-epimerase